MVNMDKELLQMIKLVDITEKHLLEFLEYVPLKEKHLDVESPIIEKFIYTQKIRLNRGDG